MTEKSDNLREKHLPNVEQAYDFAATENENPISEALLSNDELVKIFLRDALQRENTASPRVFPASKIGGLLVDAPKFTPDMTPEEMLKAMLPGRVQKER